MKTTWNSMRIVAVVAAATTTAFGVPNLTSIGVLDASNPLSQVNAITPDGRYAVGLSQNGTTAYPVLWSNTDGLIQLPCVVNFANYSSGAHGVIIRSGGTGNPDIIGIAGCGSRSSSSAWYEAPVTNVASGTWNATPAAIGQYNTARLSAAGSSWYIAGGGPNLKAARLRINAYVYADWQGGYGEQVAYSVSANSIGVGYDSPIIGSSTTHRAGYWTAVNSCGGYRIIPGTDVFSEAYGISNDGNVMSGWSGSSVDKAQAFLYTMGTSSITPLGTLLGDTTSLAIAVNADHIAVGYSSNGSREQAVIWDTTGTWDTSGDAMPCLGLLAAAGVNVSDWTSLTRVTSMSNDGKTIAGYGIWAADGSTRGFIATIPEPASLLLLALGTLALLPRRVQDRV